MKIRTTKKFFKKHKDEILKATADALAECFIKAFEDKYPGFMDAYNNERRGAGQILTDLKDG